MGLVQLKSHRLWYLLGALVVAVPLLSMSPSWAEPSPDQEPGLRTPIPWVIEPTKRLASPSGNDRRAGAAPLPLFAAPASAPWEWDSPEWLSLPEPPSVSARQLLVYFHLLKLEGG